MKSFLLGLAVAGVIAGSLFYFGSEIDYQEADHHGKDKHFYAYSAWKQKYGRVYNDKEEDTYRFKIFRKNLKKIKEHNADSTQTYTMAANQFMDLTPDEFAAQMLATKPALLKQERIYETKNEYNYPDSVDWRNTSGVLTPVKDQGMCGSCWAFSATGALEGVSMLFAKKSQSFSEQQLVDCSGSYGNMGCNGGLMTYAFQYVIDKGIVTEEEYPYVGYDQSCKKDGGAFKIKSYTDIPSGSVDAHADAVVKQPVSIAVDASNWSFYSGGIFSNCGSSLNHGVLLVGYYKKSNFWQVKNSWGLGWGEKGFIRLKWGNTCGMADMSDVPNY